LEIKLTKQVSGGVCKVAGPQVLFVLADAGRANVGVHVTLSDGTHIDFPDGRGLQTQRTTVLPAGDYFCAISVSAFAHGAFGDTYDSSVSIAGKKVATAQGTVPTGPDGESAIRGFVLRVS
jgi:hypothetical protein